jgi:hypothetical protein
VEGVDGFEPEFEAAVGAFAVGEDCGCPDPGVVAVGGGEARGVGEVFAAPVVPVPRVVGGGPIRVALACGGEVFEDGVAAGSGEPPDAAGGLVAGVVLEGGLRVEG